MVVLSWYVSKVSHWSKRHYGPGSRPHKKGPKFGRLSVAVTRATIIRFHTNLDGNLDLRQEERKTPLVVLPPEIARPTATKEL